MSVLRKVKAQLRKIVHDLYYWRAGKRRIEFAMRCREVAGHIDTRLMDLDPKMRARVKFHLTLCQACSDYDRLSTALSQAVRKSVQVQRSLDPQSLNASLLKAYANKSTDKN